MRDTVRAVVGQLEIWWFGAVTMRMADLSDDEFFWKPVPDAFCLTPRDGALFYEWPPGSRGEAIPPVTTIAWRLAHIGTGCFVQRWHEYFGDAPLENWTAEPFPTTARAALDYLEEWKTRWCESVTAAGEDGMWRPLGPSTGDIEIMQLGKNDPFIGMALHVNREVMHHGAEINLLRDLYRAQHA